MNKRELLETIRTERARWEALLAEAGPGRMSEPGASGHWTPGDVMAHLAAWEDRVVAWLEAVANATTPTPPPWPKEISEEETNDWIYRANHDRPLDELKQQSADTHRRMLALLEATPEADLQRTYDWLGGSPLSDAIPGNSSGHYHEHADWLRAWLAQSPAHKEGA